MIAHPEIIEKLVALANQEYSEAEARLNKLPFPYNLIVLIEACRVLDALTIKYANTTSDHKDIPDFEITLKGWNPLVAILLKKKGDIHGIPIQESTKKTRDFALGVLHQLGRYVLLTHTISMLKYNMADAEYLDRKIIIRMGARLQSDHFIDQTERERLKEETNKLNDGTNTFKDFIIEDIQTKLSELVFPYDTGRGIVIGYNSTNAVDNHYRAAISDTIFEWRSLAGIHPDTKIGNISGADLVAVTSLLVSSRLKHRDCVSAGIKKFPEANYYMSLVTWIDPKLLIDSISDFSGLQKDVVETALLLLTLKHDQIDYFQNESAPYTPLMIEISPGYLLAPVAGIYKNPFTFIRMFNEFHVPALRDSFRLERERWMVKELLALFEGNRYASCPACKLSRNGKTVTDIDAAILDKANGNLAIFQLKWQDYGSNEAKRQISKAKNFTSQIEVWAERVHEWLEEFGKKKLAQALGLQGKQFPEVNTVYMFGLGRLSARFKSFGQEVHSHEVAVCNWDQFIRVRMTITDFDNPLKEMYEIFRKESGSTVKLVHISHEVKFGDQIILFEDMWNIIDDK